MNEWIVGLGSSHIIILRYIWQCFVGTCLTLTYSCIVQHIVADFPNFDLQDLDKNEEHKLEILSS